MIAPAAPSSIARAFAAAPAPLRALTVAMASAATLGLYLNALVGAREEHANETLVETAETLYVADNRTMELLFLGHRGAAADVVWLRALDYFARHFTGDRRYPWLVHFVDQIIELDQRFRRVYHWAGASVLYGQRFTNENIRLSSRFYEAALKQFPEDYEAAFRLGMNYYVEMHADSPEEARRYKELGAQYLEQAANLPGATENIRNLVASVYSKLGRTELAVQSLLFMLENTEDPKQRDDIQLRLERVRGTSDAASLAEAAAAAEKRRKDTFDYLPPALFLVVDGGGRGTSTGGVPDRSWREMIPDVSVGEAQPTTEDP